MTAYRIPGPLCVTTAETMDEGTMCLGRSPLPGPLGLDHGRDRYFETAFARGMDGLVCRDANGYIIEKRLPAKWAFSDSGLSLLRSVEKLYLKPYNDQTGKATTVWVSGATIGYGHLIKNDEWKNYSKGISEADANSLFTADLNPFVAAVQESVVVKLAQYEFDALVIFAFNVGASAFKGSAVVKLVNDPKAITLYINLEAAWKAWNKSQGKVMSGLNNRRNCEWKIYADGIYESW